MTYEEVVGRTIMEARKARGMLQYQLAIKIGCSDRNSAYRLEKGDFSWKLLRDACVALKMSPGALLTLAESMSDQFERIEEQKKSVRQEIEGCL